MVGALKRRITLELNRFGVQKRIPVRQGDSLVHCVEINLTWNGRAFIPENVVLAQVYALLPNGKSVTADCKISQRNVEFVPTAELFELGGPVLCRLVLRGGDGGELYSPAFAFDAEERLVDRDGAVAARRYSEMEELLLRVLSACEKCEATEAAVTAMLPLLSDTEPQMDGTAAAGKSDAAARADHVHPSDSTKMPAMSEMSAKPSPVITDRFPLENQSDGKMMKVTWSQMISNIRKSISRVESADMASAVTDEAESGYVATIPELSDNATIALIGDIESALEKAKANGDFTPVKGVDYFTEADKAEIVEAVLSRLAEQGQ